jgi:hypothetical protein
MVEEVEHRAVRPGRVLQQVISYHSIWYFIIYNDVLSHYCCILLLPSSGVRAADAVEEDVEERTTLIMCMIYISYTLKCVIYSLYIVDVRHIDL